MGIRTISPVVRSCELPPYIANIFGTKNTGLPWEIFSIASGKPSAIVAQFGQPEIVVVGT